LLRKQRTTLEVHFLPHPVEQFLSVVHFNIVCAIQQCSA